MRINPSTRRPRGRDDEAKLGTVVGRFTTRVICFHRLGQDGAASDGAESERPMPLLQHQTSGTHLSSERPTQSCQTLLKVLFLSVDSKDNKAGSHYFNYTPSIIIKILEG